MNTLPKAGSRVGVVCGPGEFPKDRQGIVISHVTNRWGSYAVVLMDDGTTQSCNSLTERGIGWYQLNQLPATERLVCSVCGAETEGRQWHGRDTGYGLCASCVDWVASRESVWDMEMRFGIIGYNYKCKKP